MPLSIPPAVNYPSPLVPLVARWDHAPPEGPQQIPCEILWNSMGGAAALAAGVVRCVAFDVSQNAPQNFTQIAALVVDNSECGSAVKFIFTDTTDVVTIPAYAPRTCVPVFTRKTNFFVMNDNDLIASDVTRFSVFNTMPPPIAVPFTQEQSVAASGAIEVVLPSTTSIIAAGISGTIENGNLGLANTIQGGNAYVADFELRDGSATPRVLAKVVGNGWSGGGDYFENALLWAVQNVHLRFNNGVNLVMSQIGATGPAANQAFVNANLYYRTP